MKKIFLTLITLTTLAALQVFAEKEPETRESPCNKVTDACKAYIKATPSKKSVYRDCMQPLLEGEQIAGVQIDAAVLNACKIKKAELKLKK